MIPAGGSGSRFSESQDKLMVPLAGKPVLQHTLAAFLSTPQISGIVLVASQKALEAYQILISQAFPKDPIRLVSGGITRRDSVYHGLIALPDSAEIVAIHDAARPLIGSQQIEASILAVEQGAAGAVIAVPVVDTIKQVEPNSRTIEATVDRSRLWRAQTPQTFRKETILKAHQLVKHETAVTDDAQLLEHAGLGSMQLIHGDERNIKITGPNDIWLAEAFLRQR